MSDYRTEKSTLDVVVVIACLLKEASKIDKKLTPLQINKLVYICHGWALGILKKPLIDNRSGQIQAWKYGPVVTEAYEVLKRWGATPISYDTFIRTWENPFRSLLENYIKDISKKFPDLFDVIERVWYVYQDLTGGQLITITHKEETPWTRHVKKNFFGLVVHGVHIPDSSISDHYENKLRELIKQSDD